MITQKYQRTPEYVEAVQWDGSEANAREIINWMVDSGAEEYSTPKLYWDRRGELIIEFSNYKEDIVEGAWIVHHGSGFFTVRNDGIFKAVYQPVGLPALHMEARNAG